jgi:hypothetical protein
MRSLLYNSTCTCVFLPYQGRYRMLSSPIVLRGKTKCVNDCAPIRLSQREPQNYTNCGDFRSTLSELIHQNEDFDAPCYIQCEQKKIGSKSILSLILSIFLILNLRKGFQAATSQRHEDTAVNNVGITIYNFQKVSAMGILYYTIQRKQAVMPCRIHKQKEERRPTPAFYTVPVLQAVHKSYHQRRNEYAHHLAPHPTLINKSSPFLDGVSLGTHTGLFIPSTTAS